MNVSIFHANISYYWDLDERKLMIFCEQSQPRVKFIHLNMKNTFKNWIKIVIILCPRVCSYQDLVSRMLFLIRYTVVPYHFV